MIARPNSAGERPSPTIRDGAGRPAAAWRSRPRCSRPRWRRAAGAARRAGARPVARHRRDGVRVRNAHRLDGREHAAREPARRRLAALARLGLGRRWSRRWPARPPRRPGRRCRASPALLGRQAARPRRAARAPARSAPDRAGGAGHAGGARARFRSALPGFSVRAADRRRRSRSWCSRLAALRRCKRAESLR